MNIEKTATILVIDDSTTNVVLLEAILNGKGYRIETALNATEAYQLIEKQKPDLILLDLLMPRINGYDFLENIKGRKETKEIPVIVVSAVTDAENIKRTMNMGATDFIKKPVDIQNLISKVNNILNT